MMTDGQKLALWQLEEVAAASDGSIDIEGIREPSGVNGWLEIDVSIRIGSLDRVEAGLPLRERESFVLKVHPRFPFKKPEVDVTHDRFAGYPHVQWKRHLCLYQSSTEWNPSDGMFGYLDRLDYWLKQGALNQLDPEGIPLHPPAVYADRKNGKLVIPRENTPAFEGQYWIGLAGIVNLPTRIEITSWHSIHELPTEGTYALALLFGEAMPWEYPTTGASLLRECEQRGVAKEHLFRILKAASLFVPNGQPIHFVLGSPMRGFAQCRKQHLSVWAIDAETADSIRLTIGDDTDTVDITRLREKFESLLVQYLESSNVSWCPVIESRSEVTVRRDHDSALSYFRDRSVSLWGCGALGAHVALQLCRAGVRRLVLRDYGTVIPGILVRQPFTTDDIGQRKTNALQKRLLEIRPELQVDIHNVDVEESLATTGVEWSDGCDAVIDATASDRVRRRLEIIWNSTERRRVPLAGLMIDERAERLVAAVVGEEYSGAIWDVFRKAKIEVLGDAGFREFANAFFPSQINQRPFQPEPGCSEPTFIGSSADCAGMASIGLNLIAREFAKNGRRSAVAHLCAQPSTVVGTKRPITGLFEFQSDSCVAVGNQEIRIAGAALREIKAWIAQNRRLRGKTVETGGLLWGEWDDASGIVWITSASSPPPDSQHSAEGFVRGVVGTEKEHEARSEATRRSVGYVGEWHTHPGCRPLPSETDVMGIHGTLTIGKLPLRKTVLLIFGKESGVDTVGAYVFRRVTGSHAIAHHELKMGQQRLPEQIL